MIKNKRSLSTMALLSGSLLLTGCSSRFFEIDYQAVNQDAKAPQKTYVVVDAVEADSLVDQATKYRDEGLMDAALGTFGLALEENPGLVDAHLGMGHIFLDYGVDHVAENAYKRAVEAEPNNYDANYYLGLSYQMQDKIKLAIRQYLRAIAIDPQRVEANRDVASAYLQRGTPEAAIAYARKATELDPESQEVWCNLAATSNLLGMYNEAIDAYRTAAELGPLPEAAIPAFAAAHIKMKNFERAKNLLVPVVEATNDPDFYERLAYTCFKLQEFSDAMVNYEKALKLSPNHVGALNGMGGCYMTQYLQSGRKDMDAKKNAFQMWRRSLKVKPGQGQIADLLNRYRDL
ncbi:tetratricopeptide repeat protein [Planctomycetota bacterium]|nr:tetratricopeptide repeat protein [Planctomycetota bacterium]